MALPIETIAEAWDTASSLLADYLRVPVEKALDPLDPGDFVRISSRLARALRSATAEGEAEALRAAMRALDVDWRALSAPARERVVEAARLAIGTARERVMPAVEERFEAEGERVYRGARRSAARRFGLKLQPSLSLRDAQAERYVRVSASNFVRDEYGRRRDELSELVRERVARGLEEGLGSGEIAAELAELLGERVVRADSYWNVVAMSFANTARTFSQLSAYEEGGVQRYVFEAVLDEVTTDQCRFYHGRTFTVASGVERMQGVLSAAEPEDVKVLAPWVRAGKDSEGNRVLYVDRGQGREVLAQVDRSGVGSRDDTGAYSRAKSSDELAGVIPWPPLHGRCRSTVVADV